MILIPAQVKSIKSRVDKSWSLCFDTQELVPSQIMGIGSLNGKMVYLAIKIENFNQDDEKLIESLKADELEGNKTPSQRLRACLYRLFEQQPEGFKTFSEFYNARMEMLCTQIKSKLL